jgi:antitoxin YqcF
MGAPATARAAARAAHGAFGGEDFRVQQNLDAVERHSVDILRCVDRPKRGFTSYSTVTLHTAANLVDGKDIRVELAAVVANEHEEMANVLATAAFDVSKDGRPLGLGDVYPRVMLEYDLPPGLPHVLWSTPFPWDELAGVDLADQARAHWLLAVPISDPELGYYGEHGYDGLEQLFVEREIEYFDLGRPSVL